MAISLGELYELIVATGRANDPRGEAGITRVLSDAQKAYDGLPEERRWEFDRERLTNPFSDTRILAGDPGTVVGRVLVGIDIGVGEVLLADRLREKGQAVDAIIAHHPEGRALAEMDEVMRMQADVWRGFGVPINFGDAAINERMAEVKRRFHPYNTQQAIDAARLLGIPFLCCHTPADNCVQGYVQTRVDQLGPDATVDDLIQHLKTIPEYREAVAAGIGPTIFQGDASARTGRIMVEMTGGTAGPPSAIERLAAAGVGTVVDMHMDEERRKKAQENYLNVVIAGHMASDSIGMNLVLDEAERVGVETVPCSGLIRVSRTHSA